ncbi:MAG: WHG domain-containing protein [Lactobacillus sp.]|jgi:AcrR family transcriptional regulator|nr:WHG domain-containing protein [Lactobacillus sp.]
MTKRDLSRDKIVTTYIALAQELGLDKVTFPRIAERLAIKPPSLYNHFKNLTDLKIQTAIDLHTKLHERLLDALLGQSGGPALKTYALVYRQFAQDYQSVYELLNTIPNFDSPELTKIGRQNNAIITKIIQSFDLSEQELIVKNRAFRSLVNGYIVLNQLGYFQKERFDADESFVLMIEEFIQAIPNGK